MNQLRQLQHNAINVEEWRNRYQQVRSRFVPSRSAQSAFNIFTLLRVERDEVGTHSRLIADWLNPDGTHGQGALFLKQFLRVCQQRQADFQLPSQPIYASQWRVQTERYIGRGYLDVVVESPQLGVLIVIENKIGAAEQPHQLAKYARWMQTRVDQFPHQLLVFLTPMGREATTHGNLAYCPFSYQVEIDTWLKMALSQIKSRHVKSIVEQYRAILTRL